MDLRCRNAVIMCIRCEIMSNYSASHLPEAPQGSTSPVLVTGRPISWDST